MTTSYVCLRENRCCYEACAKNMEKGRLGGEEEKLDSTFLLWQDLLGHLAFDLLITGLLLT